MANILIIDDDEQLCAALALSVKSMGHEAVSSFTIRDGLQRAYTGTFDVVLLDVRMPDGDGLDVLLKIRSASSRPEVIVMTGAGDAEDASTAIKNGAWDYIEKPSSLKTINAVVTGAIQHREIRNQRKPPVIDRMGIVGDSAPMKTCLDILAQAANSDANVLITGETGTGKELFAWAIHKNSIRAHKNFVVVDCAALHETLAESVLFGHEKGAFTGADKAHEGLVSQADGGTLFLDEAGELSLSLQKVFLRVLQEHSFRPLGAKKEKKSNFRLIVATNRNLSNMVKSGDFREDLLFRFESIVIKLPPLREHPEDIKELAGHHVTKLCQRYGTEAKSLSHDLMEALICRKWPGNVRELFSVVDGAFAVSREEPVLSLHHLPSRIRIERAQGLLAKGKDKAKPGPKAGEELSVNDAPGLPSLKDVRAAALNDTEKQYLNKLMSLTKGDIKKSCRISGLSRPRLYSLLNKYGISRTIA